ncbi:MAG: GH92 family glycosyl hydrolase [Ignavibacteriaceae bacterium]
MKIKSFWFLLICFSSILSAQNKIAPYDYVNSFIGTDDMGHTFPGAAVPFGMVQLSPETDTVMYSNSDGYNKDVYKYCAGYQYSDNTIVGFSHTHFNGTGHSDLGDFLIMPTVGKLQLNPGTRDNPTGGYRSRFSHQNESAKPGYYSVKLDDYNIDVELTATEHAGFHKYIFPKSNNAHIILDLTSGIYNYDGKVVWSSIRVENDTLVTGCRQTNGWARTRLLFFAMAISKPIKSYGLTDNEKLVYKGFWRKFNQDENFPERAGHKVKAYFNYKTEKGELIKIKFAISAVSTINALKNLETEIPGWDFEKIKNTAKDKWNKELSKIQIDADNDTKINFYTSMYHSFLSPVIYSDVNGEYRGLDQNIYKANGFTDYTIFSLWDTYRALHPLFTIIQQKRTNDIVNSFLVHYEQSVHKILPIWSHYSNENWCMIGYHAVSIIADAYLKGLRNYNVDEAFKAVISSSNYDLYDGTGYYKKYGYVPEDLNSNSASKTLEYAYDDWTIYKFAKALGKIKEEKEYLNRASFYKNIFDKQTGFMRAKNSDGEFKTPFDPLSTSGQGYIEGNAWNYSLYIPQDIKGFIKLLGGNKKLISWLDSLFTMEMSAESIAESEDITKAGMIGNYVHGNEPSHHVAYMYVYAGQPWKTQERVHQIMNTMYKPSPNGLCGNDDCGQMSAWYIFSALGFYPVTPGSSEYVIGSPCVKEATVNLENRKTFNIISKNLSKENIYISEVKLNGKNINRSFITHQEIINGGELIFIMSDKPNKNWAVDKAPMPYSMSN